MELYIEFLHIVIDKFDFVVTHQPLRKAVSKRECAGGIYSFITSVSILLLGDDMAKLLSRYLQSQTPQAGDSSCPFALDNFLHFVAIKSSN